MNAMHVEACFSQRQVELAYGGVPLSGIHPCIQQVHEGSVSGRSEAGRLMNEKLSRLHLGAQVMEQRKESFPPEIVENGAHDEKKVL